VPSPRAAVLLALTATLLTGCNGERRATDTTPAGSFDFEAGFGTNLPPAVNAGSPVRIDGVNVGAVSGVKRAGSEVVVRIRLRRPPAPVIATDARVDARPRIFLEGSYFIDLDPGTAPPLRNGGRLPAQGRVGGSY
jgi:hypothetical protein